MALKSVWGNKKISKTFVYTSTVLILHIYGLILGLKVCILTKCLLDTEQLFNCSILVSPTTNCAAFWCIRPPTGVKMLGTPTWRAISASYIIRENPKQIGLMIIILKMVPIWVCIGFFTIESLRYFCHLTKIKAVSMCTPYMWCVQGPQSYLDT